MGELPIPVGEVFMSNYASSFQLNSCIINDNYASLTGGGVYVRNGQFS
jgi:hypothetical protein